MSNELITLTLTDRMKLLIYWQNNIIDNKKTRKNKEKQTPLTEENTIFIGNKPATAYVMACMTQFNSGAKTIVLKARGRAISRTVDVAEILCKRFMKDLLEVTNIQINTEQLENSEGKLLNLSAIEITISKI